MKTGKQGHDQALQLLSLAFTEFWLHLSSSNAGF